MNEVLPLLGVPLFCSASGGDPAVQFRQSTIAALSVKIAVVEKQWADLADKIREQVRFWTLRYGDETSKWRR